MIEKAIERIVNGELVFPALEKDTKTKKDFF